MKRYINKLKEHPIYKKVYKEKHLESELVKKQEGRLKDYLKRYKINKQILNLLETKGNNQKKMMICGRRAFELHNQITEIEKNLTKNQKNQLINAGIRTISQILGLPEDMVKEIHTKQEWAHINYSEINPKDHNSEKYFVNVKKPRYLEQLDSLPKKEKNKLLNLISKRLSHNLIIQGQSLQQFYRTIPLFSETIDKINPNLSNLYLKFSAFGQLAQIYQEEITQNKRINSTKVIPKIKLENNQKMFNIESYGVNFPSLYQEIIKGTYEALMHEGMPTKQELGKNQRIYRRMTANDYLEFIEFKYSPEIASKFDNYLNNLITSNEESIKRNLRIKGYDREQINQMNNIYLKTLLYREFSKFPTTRTNYFLNKIISGQTDNKINSYFINQLLKTKR